MIGSASVAVSRELFNGNVDEIAISNVALSEKDVNAIIENGLNATLQLAVGLRGKVTTTWAVIKSL